MGETTNQVGNPNDLNDPIRRRVPAAQVSHTTNEEPADGDPEAAQIRSNIEHTRAGLSETINALQEKLDPTRIAEQVKDQIREKATEAYDTAKQAVKEATIGKAEKIMANVSETASDMAERAGTAVKDSSVVQYIRNNPLPLALVGIGIGMLTLSTRKKQQSAYNTGRDLGYRTYDESGKVITSAGESSVTDRARNAAGGIADAARTATGRATSAVSSAADSVRDVASSAADTTRQQLSNVTAQVRQGTRAASDRYTNTLQENPMALGVVALAAGAIVGLVLPTTQVEGEYMGEVRDRLVGQAKSAAQEAVEKVQRVAGEAGQTLKEAAQKEGLVSNS